MVVRVCIARVRRCHSKQQKQGGPPKMHPPESGLSLLSSPPAHPQVTPPQEGPRLRHAVSTVPMPCGPWREKSCSLLQLPNYPPPRGGLLLWPGQKAGAQSLSAVIARVGWCHCTIIENVCLKLFKICVTDSRLAGKVSEFLYYSCEHT
jgi:hypothetical protein